MYKDHVILGINALNEYLDYIGVKVYGYSQQHDHETMYNLGSSIPSHIRGGITITYIDCSCKEDAFQYVRRYAHLQEIIVNPIVNMDALFGGSFQQDGTKIETVFQEEKWYKFQIVLRIHSLDDIDKFIVKLKEETEPLRFKRFNAEMDKQIAEELGSKES